MQEPDTIFDQLRELCSAQRLAVLSTNGDGSPYASLVAFAASDDLRRLYFATFRKTRKYANMQANSQVALLIDSRADNISDFARAVAATALGSARELAGRERSEAVRHYLEKHPDLEEFVTAPECALIEVSIRSFYLVSHFQYVTEYHIT